MPTPNQPPTPLTSPVVPPQTAAPAAPPGTPSTTSPASIPQAGASVPQVQQVPLQPGVISANDFADLSAKLTAFSSISRRAAESVADAELPSLHGHIASGVASGFLLVILAPGGGVAVRTGIRDVRNFPLELQPDLQREIDVERQSLIRHTLLALGMKMGAMKLNLE